MSRFTHEITVPGTTYRAHVNAARVDLDKVVAQIWGRTATARKKSPAPVVRALTPEEAGAYQSTATEHRNKFGYPA